MSHKNKKCLKVQAKERFVSLCAFGQSKYEVKQSAREESDRLGLTGQEKVAFINNAIRDKIFSYNTYSTYEKQNNYFLKWCEETYHCKTLKQCRTHVDEWLQKNIDQGLSPYTISTRKAGLCKLFGEPADHFIDTPERTRSKITRSRNPVKRDVGFSLEKNEELINFCRGTGLRRNELESLKPEQLIHTENGYFLQIKGKGGRVRNAPILGEHSAEIIHRIKHTKPGQLVWGPVPSHADIHGYRSDYATAIYAAFARPISEIPFDRVNKGTGRKYQSDVYCCQGDLKGVRLDRRAMRIVSRALGHTRIDIVAGHYIRL